MKKPIKKSSKKIAAKTVKPAAKKPTKPLKKPAKAPQKSASKKPAFNSPVPRATGNPFREGSAYSVAYDILASNPAGMTRPELVAQVSKATGKDERHAGFDVAVLLSAKDSLTGERHQSCREGFWVERSEGGFIKLQTA